MGGFWIELELSFDAEMGESAFSAGHEDYQIAIFEWRFVYDLNFVMAMIMVLDIQLEQEADQHVWEADQLVLEADQLVLEAES